MTRMPDENVAAALEACKRWASYHRYQAAAQQEQADYYESEYQRLLEQSQRPDQQDGEP